MMSRMMRWQLEIPLRQVLYISFSLAFLCNWNVRYNYHKYFFGFGSVLSHGNKVSERKRLRHKLNFKTHTESNWRKLESSFSTYVLLTRARWKYRRLCSNWQTLNRDSPLTISALTSPLLKFSAMSAVSNAEFQSSFNRWHLESNTIASWWGEDIIWLILKKFLIGGNLLDYWGWIVAQYWQNVRPWHCSLPVSYVQLASSKTCHPDQL